MARPPRAPSTRSASLAFAIRTVRGYRRGRSSQEPSSHTISSIRAAVHGVVGERVRLLQPLDQPVAEEGDLERVELTLSGARRPRRLASRGAGRSPVAGLPPDAAEGLHHALLRPARGRDAALEVGDRRVPYVEPRRGVAPGVLPIHHPGQPPVAAVEAVLGRGVPVAQDRDVEAVQSPATPAPGAAGPGAQRAVLERELQREVELLRSPRLGGPGGEAGERVREPVERGGHSKSEARPGCSGGATRGTPSSASCTWLPPTDPR